MKDLSDLLKQILDALKKILGLLDKPVEQVPVVVPDPVETPLPKPEPLPAHDPVVLPPTPAPAPLPPPTKIEVPLPAPPVVKPPSAPKIEYIKNFTPFPWGVAIKKSTTAGSVEAKQLLLEGDCFVTENGVGMAALNPEEGKFDFSNLDSMLKAANGKPLFVFHIIWGHASLPDFVTRAKGNRALVEKHFKNYIQTLVSTYKGKIKKYVVVNEAFEANGTFKKCFWLQELGPDYIPLAFKYAHEADPEAELILNDFDLEYGNKKVPSVVAYVKDQIKAGVPIHAIGSQMHTFSKLGTGGYLKNYKNALKSLVSTGLKIYISELDVTITDTPANVAVQRTTYLEVVKAYTELVPANQQGGIFLWSLIDEASYKNFDSKGKKISPPIFFPALMKGSYVRKPVYDDLLNYFKSLKK